ncbi:hypothetical protein GJ697_28755 [Pseudoduganella sp. FT25W]|jgi:hypothetical protein|uniref:Big-1 domain-containing protein n=1 Tax=Duganella alba TaxID=2666081 RepID=A0A6L5QPM9_9BURK|nr:Ig-like domain-containing protein [Duganella alba]MRX11826.1 hypothetical protein [Duganella alba]MRX19945.1 hypothetical protein [Duganella alba]
MTSRRTDCFTRYLLALLCAMFLAACGGGGGGNGGCTTIDPNRDSSLPGCGTGTGTGTTGKAAVTLTVTDGSGVALTTLAPGSSATLSAVLKDANNAAVPNTLVTFTSTDKNAVFSAAGGAIVTDGNGKATVQLSPGTATTAGSYVITATGTVAGAAVTASANYTVGSAPTATASQLTFVSALPQNIALKGTGGAGRQESATITFKVLDASGNPVAGQQVSFALNTTVGGITLTPASAVSAAGGLVSTTVASGTVNTPVRVTATLNGSVSTLSDQLVVSTGVPEQNSFTLSAVIRNVEGGQYNGCTAPTGTTVTARLADHFHNPAPDGTAVSFTAEGGSIDASCLTGLTSTTLTDGTVITQKGTPGECTVRYCAGNPRPADGRVTVLAYALGEESFTDTNGNNRYDAGEPYTDLGDPFRNDRAVTDANANGIDDAFTSGNAVRASGEQYIDSNGNSNWDQSGNGVYNGVLQTTPNISGSNTVHVRQAMVMVLSNSTAAVSLLSTASGAGTLALDHCTDGTAFANTTHTYSFAIRDNNPTVFAPNRRSAHAGDPLWLFDRPGNPLPAGTQISFATSNGILQTPASITVANTSSADSSAWVYNVSLISDASQNAGLVCSNVLGSGLLNITVTTPNGTITQFSYPVTD